MMEEMNKWLSAHKKLCVITGIFGLLVSPFLWPIFLAVIIQSLSLVIPVAAGLFFYEKFIMKKDKEETNENDDDNKQQKNHADARKVHADAEKTEDLPKNHEKGSETINFDNQEKQSRSSQDAGHRLPYGTKMRAVSGSRRFGKLWNLKIDIGFQ